MHPALDNDGILTLLACELVESGLKATAVSFACCCRRFELPVLDELWRTQDELIPLLKCLPQEIWTEVDGNFHFRRTPTQDEWKDIQRYAQRMQSIKISYRDFDASKNVFLLQRYTASELLFPNLKSFQYFPNETDALTPFIHLLLSPQTTKIEIEPDPTPPPLEISTFPIFCPNLEHISFRDRHRRDVSIEVVSGMLITCNRDSLRYFLADCPLTWEAREVVCQFPKLSELQLVIEGPELLPKLALPNLTELTVKYDNSLEWLQGFHGATLDKLESVIFRSHSKRFQGNILENFERFTRNTSIRKTLSRFRFTTFSSWDLGFSPLLSFTQLKELKIGFACGTNCSLGVDDKSIKALARAMPKLEVLLLGGLPCGTPAGATVRGLVALTSHCLHLCKLRIHFQADTLDGKVKEAAIASLPIDKSIFCALTCLEVGDIPIPFMQSDEAVARVLLQIFPHISHVQSSNRRWESVARKIDELRQSRASVFYQRKAHPLAAFDNS